VIGGLIAFGVIGLFVGPVVLAVTYTTLQGWIRGNAPAAQPDAAAAQPTPATAQPRPA
jgi:predicted PurR-regulated permease PerM